MAVLDALTAAAQISTGFADGGDSRLFLSEDRSSPDGRREERRLRALVPRIPAWIEQSETYFVDPAMVPLVCSGGAVLEDDVAVQVYDPPSPFGFLLIGNGATVVHSQALAVDDDSVSAEAFQVYLWATFGGSITVARFAQSPDYVWGLLDTSSIPVGGTIPPPVRPKNRAYKHRVVVPNALISRDERSVPVIFTEESRELLSTPNTGTTDATLRWLVSCWRLMGQTVSDVEIAGTTRQQRRQLERKNVPLRQVSIIKLRRRGSRGDAGAAVDWSHRWVVRGHWRMQRYKDAKGEWTTRPVFIHPYIKGPESKPVLARQRINHLIR